MPLMKSVEDHLKLFAENLFHNNPRNVLSHQDSGSIISMILGSFMVSVKRLFDGYMDDFGQSLREVKLHKRVRIGIIPAIQRYAEFVKNAENVFENTDRRTDLEKWYGLLYDNVCDGINHHSESVLSKSPPSVVRFENYHKLYSTIDELKVLCLDSLRKNAKQQRNENISQYVRDSLGKPLEHVQIFFDALHNEMVVRSIKPEMISFQPQFSMIELTKVVALYPAKVVKKGLEELYKKVEEHLMQNSSLLQVVWRHTMKKFIEQLQDYQKVISECYAGSKVELDVSIDQVVEMFSDIAQQH